MDVAHDHHVGGVAEDAAQALDLPTLAQVLSRVGMPQLVCPDPKAGVDPLSWTPCRLTAIVSGITSWAAA